MKTAISSIPNAKNNRMWPTRRMALTKKQANSGEVEAKSTKLIWKPQNTVPIAGDDADKLMRLLDVLDDLDDVANIYDNSDLSAEEIARLAG